MPRAASSGGLLLRDDNRPMRLAGFGQAHGHIICRSGLEKMKNLLAELRASQLGRQQLGREDIGDVLDVVSGARMALYVHAKITQRLDPFPDSLSFYANFTRDFCAADHICRVFRK